jgi:hypothetical protein
MKPIILALVTVCSCGRMLASMAPLYRPAADESEPVFLTDSPPGLRDWRLISLSHLTAGKLGQLRSHLGNDIAITAYREGTLPFPDGAIVAALHDAVSQRTTMSWPCLESATLLPSLPLRGLSSICSLW